MLANESSSGLKVVLRSRMDEVIQVGRGLCWLMMSGSGDRVTCTVSLDCCSATVLVSDSVAVTVAGNWPRVQLSAWRTQSHASDRLLPA